MIEKVNTWINLYNSGLSIDKVARETNSTRMSIYHSLKRNGIILRDRRTFYFDENFLDNIDSQEKAYFLGFLSADGFSFQNTVGIDIGIEDVCLLEKFKKNFNFPQKIEYTNRNSVRIRFNSKNFVEKLKKYHIIPNKSKFHKFPEIPKVYTRHFIRGYFDGDGSIGHHKVQTEYGYRKDYIIKFIGTDLFCESLKDILKEGLNIDSSLQYIESKDKNYLYATISFGKKSALKKLFEYMYTESNIYLERKYITFLEFYKYSDNKKVKKYNKK